MYYTNYIVEFKDVVQSVVHVQEGMVEINGGKLRYE